MPPEHTPPEPCPEPWAPPPTRELTTADGRSLTYCLYGPPDGTPVVSLPGAPGTRWERPDVVEAFERAGLRVLVPDRPGYGGSARRPARRVAAIAHDVRALTEAEGWRRFAVAGHSGGAPHALACAALLPGVTRCAVVAGLAPPDAAGLDFLGRDRPGRGDGFVLAARGEQFLRPRLAARAAEVLAAVESEALAAGSVAGDGIGRPRSPGRAQRMRAMFEGGVDGWADDQIALVHPWGFDARDVRVPVGVWYGTADDRSPRTHAEWLLAHLPAAEGHEYTGGHEPDDAESGRILAWLAGSGRGN